MEEKNDIGLKPVAKAPLPWWLGGLLLGLVMVFAVWAQKPLGVSTQFVVVDSVLMHQTQATSDYAASHPLLSQEKYKALGYGFWLNVGLLGGALITVLAIRKWKLQSTCEWWKANQGASIFYRLVTGFFGGILILFGARIAHGCTSGQFASGWAQLSVSALPLTIGLFAAGMFVAKLIYPKTPEIEK